MRPDNGGFVDLFGVHTSTESCWFTAKLEFAENGNDFATLIRSFGALGRVSNVYKPFRATEVEEIKRFLEKYFSSEDIPAFPEINKGRSPLAIHYSANRIIDGSGELYKSDGFAVHRVAGTTSQNKSR